MANLFSNSEVKPTPTMIEVARSWIGTPYRHQASLKGVGADCLGFLRGVYAEVYKDHPHMLPPELNTIPTYTASWAESPKGERLLDAANEFLLPLPRWKGPLDGLVVLFRIIPTSAVKHCGIFTEGTNLIHAYENHGVVEEPIRSDWLNKEMHFFKFPEIK